MQNCIALKVMQQRGWQEVEDEYDWEIFWCAKPAVPPPATCGGKVAFNSLHPLALH